MDREDKRDKLRSLADIEGVVALQSAQPQSFLADGPRAAKALSTTSDAYSTQETHLQARCSMVCIKFGPLMLIKNAQDPMSPNFTGYGRNLSAAMLVL